MSLKSFSEKFELNEQGRQKLEQQNLFLCHFPIPISVKKQQPVTTSLIPTLQPLLFPPLNRVEKATMQLCVNSVQNRVSESGFMLSALKTVHVHPLSPAAWNFAGPKHPSWKDAYQSSERS